jgi:hypothetical protein
MNSVLSGVLIAFYAIIALFFARFWVSARERLFAMFALAFTVLAIQRLALVITRSFVEDQTAFYVLRLIAFVIIIIAIIDKNRR